MTEQAQRNAWGKSGVGGGGNFAMHTYEFAIVFLTNANTAL
jgi:hypothetical protein